MLFSDAFSLNRTEADDWFDPLLNQDTKLFIDPFLIYDNERGVFLGSHEEVISFFNHVLILISKSGGQASSPNWKRAERLLFFPEVEEICLGYTALGTRGAGSGRHTAHRMAQGLLGAVRAGVQVLTHFEEVQIFEEGIGADRISDATAALIRNRLVKYTNSVVERHDIQTSAFRFDRGEFDLAQGRWINREYNLPTNPINGKPVLLVPIRYLRQLPTINPSSFWDYCFDNFNETLRQKYGDDITRHVSKRIIVDLAKSHPQFRSAFISSAEQQGPRPYDLVRDPKGIYRPAVNAFTWAKENPKPVSPKSESDLVSAVISFVEDFRNFVENQRGWKLLWNDNVTPRSEAAFQALLMQTISTHCRYNNIDVSAEANIGRGPVDFKIADGYSARLLIEAKLARNTRFWHGLEKQLPKYLQAEGIRQGGSVSV